MAGLNPPIRWMSPPLDDQELALALDDHQCTRDDEKSMSACFSQDVCTQCVPLLQTRVEKMEEKMMLRMQALVQKTEEKEREMLRRLEAKLDVERVQALIADDLDVYNTHVQQLLEGVGLDRV